jgi:lysophospholipase L1-like esterase
LVLTPLRGGDAARVRLSNRFDAQPISLGSVYIGKQRRGANLVRGSNREVRFGGNAKVTIPAGKDVLSDPVRFSFRAFQRLAVSVYVRAPGGPVTEHAQAEQTSFITPPGSGDLTAHDNGAGFSSATTTRPLLTGIETKVSRRAGVIVAVGASFTDGFQLDPTLGNTGIDLDARYPDFLARRVGPGFAVLNEGITGNRILQDGFLPTFAPSLLHRLAGDVLNRPGITDVIFQQGINDMALAPQAWPAELSQGIKRVVDRLHDLRGGGRRNLNVLVGTLSPAFNALEGPGYGSAEANANREQVNRFIRASGIGDGYVDFDRALRDPKHPTHLLPAYDSGDHFHPNAAGYRAMARAVNLSSLKGASCQ